MARSEGSPAVDKGNDKEANNDRATWNQLQRRFLVELLVEFDRPGSRQQKGWSNAAWNEITRRFRAKFPYANFSLKQIKEQEHTLKKQYKTIKHLREQSGFGWDPIKNMVSAPEEVWAPLMRDKTIKRWYNKSFPYYDDLHKLYSGSRRRGSNCFINHENLDLRVDSPSPSIQAPGQAYYIEFDDRLLNTQDRPSFQPHELPISTPPLNIPFPQESPSFQPAASTQDPALSKSKTVGKRKTISRFHDDYLAYKREEIALICAAIEKSPIRSVERAEKFSIQEAMYAFQELQGFDLVDLVYASEMFIADSGVREAFLSCREAIRADWIRMMIIRYKEKHKIRAKQTQAKDINTGEKKYVQQIYS